MKALIQKVIHGKVMVEDECVGEIDAGYVVFLSVKKGDSKSDASYLADKTAALRIFPDDNGRMNRSIMEKGGNILVVSQFTLHADTRKGNRPSFIMSALPDAAEKLYEHYVDCLRNIMGPDRIATGRFQAVMTVEIVNDGPVTIELKSRNESF